MPVFTLKTRVTVIFPVVITIVMVGVLVLMHSMLQDYVKKRISDHQFQMVSMLADDIDQSIADNHQSLITISTRITAEMSRSPEKTLKYLQSQSEHLRFFDNGLYLFDREGRIIAETPQGLSRLGTSFSFREYWKQTVAGRKPLISDPYLSSQSHQHPAIMFTVPVFGEGDELIAMLGGSVDLTTSPFIKRLSMVRLTKGGYVYLYSKDRMLISHPDKNRIMKRDVPPGANRLFDLAIEGFQGTDETLTSRGLHTLSSFKHLKTKNWIIAANYPVSEAYAPVRKLRNIFLLAVPLFSLTIFWFMRGHLKRLTDPIINLTRHVEEFSKKEASNRMFKVHGDDEVAILGRAFNSLVTETDKQQQVMLADLEKQRRIDSRLKLQNEYLQALHETTVGLISRHDVFGVLQTIVERAGNLIGTEHCFLYLKNSTGTEMEMQFQSGIYNNLIHYPLRPGQGLAGRVWSSGEPFRVGNYSRWEGRLPDSDRDVLRAMAGVPLLSGDDVIGVLGLAFIEEGLVFSDDQMDLLTSFGELASLALENARLSEDSQRELAERKKAEEHLRKLSVAVEQSPASIIITDIHGQIEYVNPHFTLLTGYQPDEAIGRNPSILKSGETTLEEYRLLWESILSGREWRGEFHNRKKNGELYWEQALIAPIRDEKGNTTHFICIKEDISERKHLETQLRHSQKMEAVGQLAGGIAHDFNNILTAIIGYSTIIRIKLPEDSPLKRNAEQIVNTAEKGATLTQGLLAFSRKQVSNLFVVDLNEVLNRVQQLLLRLISENINLAVSPYQEPLPVMADSAQIEQVLMNLITNASDAMPKGGVIEVTAGLVCIDSGFMHDAGFGKPGNYAVLTISDNGVGMDEETVKHAFEPFFTTKEVGKGTGLGLSIVYGIIKKHNGFIDCKSAIGTGTTMRIYLPLLSESSIAVVPAKEQSEPQRREGEVVLIAEDNEMARLLAKEVLSEFGYSVLVAGDGAEALELFRENADKINLVMLDVIMPKQNGRETYEAIRALNPSVRVLFCSGYPEEAIISQGKIDKGMNFLPKPYSPKELLIKIREVLDNGD